MIQICHYIDREIFFLASSINQCSTAGDTLAAHLYIHNLGKATI